jgi:hypothetical protein
MMERERVRLVCPDEAFFQLTTPPSHLADYVQRGYANLYMK